jgi:hypothetical protein
MTQTKKTNWELIVGLLALVFTFYTWYIGEKRYQTAKEKDEGISQQQKKLFDLTKEFTGQKINRYYSLIHTKRTKEFFELYDSLTSISTQQNEYTDNLFKQIVGNHTSYIQMWTSRINNENLKVTLDQLNRENYDLLNLNKNLYIQLCAKYNYSMNSNFFENCYFY